MALSSFVFFSPNEAEKCCIPGGKGSSQMEMGKQLVNAARKRREEKENTVLTSTKLLEDLGIVDVEVWEPGIGGFYDASELSFSRELMDLWHGDLNQNAEVQPFSTILRLQGDAILKNLGARAS